VATVKHNSFNKAPFNDEALSREKKFHGGSRFTSHKVYLLSCCQVISQWMQACYAIKMLWVIFYYTFITF